MFNWQSIYERFLDGYGVKRTAELARILQVTKQTTHDWKTGKSHVPWRRMKRLIDETGMTWDWLLEGLEPKFHKCIPESSPSMEFEWEKINDRFLGLFPDKRQHIIAKGLEVSQETVSKWYRHEMHVPWEKLQYAKANFGVSWDWLINGLE